MCSFKISMQSFRYNFHVTVSFRNPVYLDEIVDNEVEDICSSFEHFFLSRNGILFTTLCYGLHKILKNNISCFNSLVMVYVNSFYCEGNGVLLKV